MAFIGWSATLFSIVQLICIRKYDGFGFDAALVRLEFTSYRIVFASTANERRPLAHLVVDPYPR